MRDDNGLCGVHSSSWCSYIPPRLNSISSLQPEAVQAPLQKIPALIPTRDIRGVGGAMALLSGQRLHAVLGDAVLHL